MKTDSTKKKAILGFNQQAKDYDNSNDSKHARTIYPFVLEKLDHTDYHSVLDVGCGTGAVLSAIMNRNKNRPILAGIDISPEMIKVANARLGVHADLRTGDAENLPWNDNSFDVVLCIDSFHHYPNPEKALSEINRVVKPNGRLILADLFISGLRRQVINLFIRFSKEGDVRVYSKAEICAQIEAAGFKNISWELVTSNAFLLNSMK